MVIHSAESTSARGVANFFASRSSRASTQLAVDQTSCHRMLSDLTIPWGAPGANTDGLHIEICGYAKWTRSQWLSRRTMLRRAAYRVSKWCWQYDIPIRRLTVAQVRGRKVKGITCHNDVSQSFKGSDHWDPGLNFPWDVFMGYVNQYYNQHEVKKEKGKVGSRA